MNVGVAKAVVLVVAALLGAVHDAGAAWAIPILFLIGLCFAGMGLVVTALAPSYDYFNYYFTLVMTPMFILSGVFYPVESLPAALQSIVQVLPLYHAVELVRPLVAGRALSNVGLHVGVLTIYGTIGFLTAVAFARRRLVV